MAELPRTPQDPQPYLDLIGLIGVIRVAMFEAFGDRRFWDERFFDLFMGMLAKQLRGTVSTAEEMTGSISGVSHSTKVRIIEEARKAGLIVAANRSEVRLEKPLDDVSARKVFFLSETAVTALLARMDEARTDIRMFARRDQGQT